MAVEITDENEYRLQRMYDDFLDDIYPEVNIGGYTYYTSYALKNVDEMAYRQGFLDFCDSLEEE